MGVWSKSEIKWYKCKKVFFEGIFRYFGLIFGENRDFEPMCDYEKLTEQRTGVASLTEIM